MVKAAIFPTLGAARGVVRGAKAAKKAIASSRSTNSTPREKSRRARAKRTKTALPKYNKKKK